MSEAFIATTKSEPNAPRFTAELWEAFWSDPTGSSGGDVLGQDIIGYWPEDPEPVIGLLAYSAKMEALLEAYPDMRLELVDSATVPGSEPNEELVFLHYIGRATGPKGPFELRGLDRVRTRDGVVIENVIRYTPSHLNA